MVLSVSCFVVIILMELGLTLIALLSVFVMNQF